MPKFDPNTYSFQRLFLPYLIKLLYHFKWHCHFSVILSCEMTLSRDTLRDSRKMDLRACSSKGRNGRVAQMAKKCQTYWDQCFSHLFYLVILENGQKVQKKCCLRVPNFKSRNGLIYIVISGQKWLFLHQLSFGPLNGSENTNKPLETHGHMPIPNPGPKEHQIWAF